MAEERSVVVCQPVTAFEGRLVEGTVVRFCNVCATEVALSPASLELVEDGAEPLCWDCARGAIESLGMRLAMSPRQRAELNAIGISDAEIEVLAQMAERDLRGR